MANQNRIAMFDKALGWDKIRKEFEKDFSYESIKKYWEFEANAFKIKASKYFLY